MVTSALIIGLRTTAACVQRNDDGALEGASTGADKVVGFCRELGYELGLCLIHQLAIFPFSRASHLTRPVERHAGAGADVARRSAARP